MIRFSLGIATGVAATLLAAEIAAIVFVIRRFR